MTDKLFIKASEKAIDAMLRECISSDEIPGRLVEYMFSNVIDELFSAKEGGTCATAEGTAAELIRLGVPKKSMVIGYQHTLVPLRNATYTLHRLQHPQGTVAIHWKEYQYTIRPMLSAKELARAILDLDAMLPKLEEVGEEMVRRVAVQKKAEEIVRITVLNQLEAVMPALGIRCGFDIRHGKVHIDLHKTFSGSVDIPLTELPDFLADTERILALLQPPKEGEVVDTHITFPNPFPHGFGWRRHFP